eukprot:SAG31_NODE_2698_length_5225_cov_11.224542_2_plen_34_part_00
MHFNADDEVVFIWPTNKWKLVLGKGFKRLISKK